MGRGRRYDDDVIYVSYGTYSRRVHSEDRAEERRETVRLYTCTRTGGLETHIRRYIYRRTGGRRGGEERVKNRRRRYDASFRHTPILSNDGSFVVVFLKPGIDRGLYMEYVRTRHCCMDGKRTFRSE